MDDEYIKPPPISDYYITYHALLRAIAILEESVYLLTNGEVDIVSDIQVDQKLFKRIFEVKRCLESIQFKHDVLSEPVNNE